MTMNLEKVIPLISDIEEEIAILKTVLENCIQNNYEFVPMIVFYSNNETKEMVIAPAHYEDFSQKMTSIAECLHLYAATNAYSAYVAMLSKFEDNDIVYDALAITVISYQDAGTICIPYSIKDNNIIWHNELGNINDMDGDIDSVSKDVINMFYNFSHLNSMSFSTSEILSYLSSKGAAIEMFAADHQYISVQSDSHE